MDCKNKKGRILVNYKSKKEGITLISLVITIIVLIIIAGISINLILGENGIIQKAKQSKVAQTEAEAKEKVEMLLAEYAMEKELKNKTLLEFLQEKESNKKIEEMVDNGNGTYTLIVDGYMIEIDENRLSIEQIEEETQFRRNTKGKAKFIINSEIEYTSSVQVSMQIDDSVKMYTIQYNTIDKDKESSNWITYTPNTTFSISENGIIYGRIINEETNEVGYNFKEKISNIDKEKPKNAIVSFNTMLVNVNETIQATITQEDSKSGIDINNCKYIVNNSETEIGIDSTSWDNATVFTKTPQIINITKATIGTYYLHILSVDKVGNKIETISEGIKFKGAIYYLNTEHFAGTGYSGAMSGWTVKGSSNNLYLETRSTAYVVKNSKISVDDINKITFNYSLYSGGSSVTGTVILGLTETPESTDFISESTISYSWKNYPTTIILDTSNLQGEYYLKVVLNAKGNSYGRLYGPSTIKGE